MKVDLKLLPLERTEGELEGKTVVIVDVLRATSVMVTALNMGVKYVLPVEKVEQAFHLRKMLKEDVILVGERNSLKIDGFDFCNSPTELLEVSDLRDEKMILTTTNGTKTVVMHSKADCMIASSFLNMRSSVNYTLSRGQDVLLVCSGTNGKFAVEDFVFCGEFIERMRSKCERINLSSSAYVAWKFYRDNVEDVDDIVMMGEHAKNLMNLGFRKDVEFCIQRDIYNIVAKAEKKIIAGREYVIFKPLNL